jgi:hypothetical protein
MNYTFNRGFNNGFRNTFYSNKKFNFSSFFKNASNNKNMFNMFGSSTNSQKFRINLSNKYFIDKAYFLASNPIVSGQSLGAKMLTGEAKSGSELEKSESENSSMNCGDYMAMINGFFLMSNGKINHKIGREVMEHLNPVAKSEVHDPNSCNNKANKKIGQ